MKTLLLAILLLPAASFATVYEAGDYTCAQLEEIVDSSGRHGARIGQLVSVDELDNGAIITGSLRTTFYSHGYFCGTCQRGVRTSVATTDSSACFVGVTCKRITGGEDCN